MSKAASVSEAVILLRAASQPGKSLAESEYCAGILTDQWVRLSPLSFHRSQSARQLKRWDKVRFASQGSGEQLHVAPHSLMIVGELPAGDRLALLERIEVTSLAGPTREGKTLALLRPKDAQFIVQKKTDAELKAELEFHQAQVNSGTAQAARKPFAYRFRYKFKTTDGAAESTYVDSEMNGTMARLAKSFGEAGAVSRLMRLYGKEYLKQGVYFIMSRHSAQDTEWNIAAVIGMDETAFQSDEEAVNVVC